MKRISDWAWELYEAMPRQLRVRDRVFRHFLKGLALGIPVSILRGLTRQHNHPASVVIGAVHQAEFQPYATGKFRPVLSLLKEKDSPAR